MVEGGDSNIACRCVCVCVSSCLACTRAKGWFILSDLKSSYFVSSQKISIGFPFNRSLRTNIFPINEHNFFFVRNASRGENGSKGGGGVGGEYLLVSAPGVGPGCDA